MIRRTPKANWEGYCGPLKLRFSTMALTRVLVPAMVMGWGTAVLGQQSRTLVVPNAMANVEGNIGNSFPFNIGANTIRYQQIYASSQFGAMPPGGAQITAIAFRADAGWGRFTGTLP